MPTNEKLSVRTFRIQVAVTLLLLGVVLAVFEPTDLDLRVQDACYDQSAHAWRLTKQDTLWRAVLYHGLKGVSIAVGVCCAIGLVASLRHKQLVRYQRALAIVMLSVIVTPLLIWSAKQVSNVYTPRQIERYGGQRPYVKVFESYPADYVADKPGKGWPAAHPSGGFALMALYFATKRRGLRLAGLLIGLVAGWAMGLYQMLHGQHYLSHVLITMLVAWLVALVLARYLPLAKTPEVVATQTT